MMKNRLGNSYSHSKPLDSQSEVNADSSPGAKNTAGSTTVKRVRSYTSGHPIVSVIMAVNDGEAYLAEAIESVARQTFEDFELIVVDDGSEDGTARILREASDVDSRIKVLSRSKSGLTASLNLAASHSRATMLARMDADDVCEPTRFEKQLGWFRQNPDFAALGAYALKVDPDGWEICEWRVPTVHEEIDRHHMKGRGGGIIHPLAMIRKEHFLQVGGYDESLSAAQDYDLWLKLAEVGRLGNLPEVLLKYRLHLRSTTFGRRVEQNQCLERAFSNAVLRRGLEPASNTMKRLPRAHGRDKARREWIMAALRGNNFNTALKHARIWHHENRFALFRWGVLAYCWLASARDKRQSQ